MVDRAIDDDDQPELAKDAYWDVVVPDDLPYTPESYAIERNHQHHSLFSSDEAADVVNAGVDGVFDDLPTSRGAWILAEAKAAGSASRFSSPW